MPTIPYGLRPQASPTPPAPGGSAPPQGVLSRFVGRGINAPFRRGAADIVTVSEIELIRGNLRQILGTRAGTPFSTGELPWRPEFGSKVHFLLHKPNTALTEAMARFYTVEAISRWEPRVIVRGVTMSKQKTQATGPRETPVLLLNLLWAIRTTSRSESIVADGLADTFVVS